MPWGKLRESLHIDNIKSPPLHVIIQTTLKPLNNCRVYVYSPKNTKYFVKVEIKKAIAETDYNNNNFTLGTFKFCVYCTNPIVWFPCTKL